MREARSRSWFLRGSSPLFMAELLVFCCAHDFVHPERRGFVLNASYIYKGLRRRTTSRTWLFEGVRQRLPTVDFQ